MNWFSVIASSPAGMCKDISLSSNNIVFADCLHNTGLKRRTANLCLLIAEKMPGSVLIRYDLSGTYVHGRLQ